MHWEDWEVEWQSLDFQAFSSNRTHSSFPFQPQSHTSIPISSSSGAFQNSEDCNVAIPSKCSPLPMPIISQCGGQMHEVYTSLQAKESCTTDFHLWPTGDFALMCSSHQHNKGARKWEKVWPSRTGQSRKFLSALHEIHGLYPGTFVMY